MSVKVLPILCASVLISLVRGDSLLTPCRTDDVDCLTKTTSQFLSNTCKGIPEYDIRAIDPLHISSTDYKVPDGSGLIFHFKNLEVTGLKDQTFSDFKMDTKKQDVVLTTNANINVVGDVTMERGKKSKTFSGTFSLSGSVAGTATYNYSFNVDDKGVKHYIVGPEEITCQALGENVLTIAPELQQALDADPEIKVIREQNKDRIRMLRNESLCHITRKAYVTLIHNLRAAAKLLPTTDFLIGV
ncbi:juvenile hormone-binding protein-like [Epargyreus clarus]|uniref:juvenile hormone-binding protein-like n=1 Tax=Epargyreus clarus TaxID=520877 RepID=UPI003C2D4351